MSEVPKEYLVGESPNVPAQFMEKPLWNTKDLYLAAAILALKYGTLESVDRSDRRHMRFYFSGAGLNEISAEWTNRKLTVNAAEYADGIRKMKSLIHLED